MKIWPQRPGISCVAACLDAMPPKGEMAAPSTSPTCQARLRPTNIDAPNTTLIPNTRSPLRWL